MFSHELHGFARSSRHHAGRPEEAEAFYGGGNPDNPNPWILDAKAQSFLVNAPPPEDFRESPLALRMLLAFLR